MWLVVFYAPNNVRKVLFKSEQRGEAEASQQRFVQLLGAEFKIEVVFDEPPTALEKAKKGI